MSLFLEKFGNLYNQIKEYEWTHKYKQTYFPYNFGREGVETLINQILLLDLNETTQNNLKEIVKDWADLTDDKKMLMILRWVRVNITYRKDKYSWDKIEYWQTAQQTLDKETGDCEDGAILIYHLARAAGIPAWKLQLAVGDVQDFKDSTKTVGHCWLQYISIQINDLINIDWCYWPATSEYALVSYIAAYYQEEYKNIWCAFNEDAVYSRHTSDYIEHFIPDSWSPK